MNIFSRVIFSYLKVVIINVTVPEPLVGEEEKGEFRGS